MEASRQLSARLIASLPKKKPREERRISAVYIDPVTCEPMVAMAVPVIDVFADFKGTLIAEVNLKFMWDIVDHLKVGRTGYVYVADRMGNLLAFQDTARVLKGENVSRLQPVADFMKIPTSAHSGRVTRYEGIRGSVVLGTYAPLKTPDWAVVTELPWQEAYRETIQDIGAAVGITLSMAILAGVFGIFMARRLAVPVMNLTETASRIAAGERDLEATVRGPREIALLAVAFNSMTAQLRQSLGDLEQRLAELTRTEESLRLSEERLRLALEGTSDGIWDWNIQTGQAYFSPRYYTMMGYEPGEFPGSYDSWRQLLHPDDVEASERVIQRAIEEHSSFAIEFRLKAKNGEWRWILGRGKVVESDAAGKAVRVAGSHTDITKRKRAEEMLEKRIVALTQPLSDVGGIAVEDLLNLSDIQRLQDLFAKASGVAVLMTRPDGTPITQPSNFTELCAEIIRKTPKGAKNCNVSDAMIGRHNPSGPNIQPCLSAALCNAGASITVGGHHIANWLIGQVRNADQKEEEILEYAREIGADETAFRAAYRKVPVMSQRQFENTAQVLFELATQISTAAYQNVQQARFITERKQAEEALRKYERIVSTSQDIMALVSRNYVYEAVNESYLMAHQKTREEVIGRKVSEIMGESVFQEMIRPRLDEVLSGGTVHYQAPFDFAGIGRRIMDVKYFPMFDEKGRIEGIVVNSRDITATRKLEEQLMQSQKIESIGTLAGGVAHEINNPINGIMNYAQLILDQEEREGPAREFAREILQETERVARIVRNLLTFARHEKRSYSQALLSDIVSAVLSLIRTVMRHDQIVLELSIPEDLPKIMCRSQQIQQVLMNLMTNARDALNERYPAYSPDKRLRVFAEVIMKEDRRFIRTTVEDWGIGIPLEIRDRIFDPFFTTKPKEMGTGLGLSISYGIVRDHGGELTVESEPGRTTRFHMDLPVDLPAETDW
jgi:PAS domain S-box-containing protein